jgi:hypothetical protein
LWFSAVQLRIATGPARNGPKPVITPAENAIFQEMPALPECSCVFGLE